MKVRKVELTLDESITMRCLLGNGICSVKERLSRVDELYPEDKQIRLYWENELEIMETIYGKLCCEMVDKEED